MRFPNSGLCGYGSSCGARCFAVVHSFGLRFLLHFCLTRTVRAALFSQ
jgi:hypothetical protein